MNKRITMKRVQSVPLRLVETDTRGKLVERNQSQWEAIFHGRNGDIAVKRGTIGQVLDRCEKLEAAENAGGEAA